MPKIRQLALWVLIPLLLPSCKVQRPFTVEEAVRRIVPSSQWGGTPISDQVQPRRHKIRRLTLHHGGEDFLPGRDVAGHLRNLQDWSRRKKRWMDIPYHFIIDLQGRTYACRPLEFPGDTNTEYDPTGHALVCVLGNFDKVSPSREQLRAVQDVFALLCARFSLGPEAIAGHKDYSGRTACPGRNLYARLADGEIQAGVRRRLADLAKEGRAGVEGSKGP